MLIRPAALTALALTGAVAACGGTATPPPEPPPTAVEKAPPPASQPVKKVEPLLIAADVKQRLAQFAPTDVDFDEKLVSATDRKVLVKLVQAARILNDIFLDQAGHGNRALRQRLVEQKAPQEALDYFDINYGPWDRLKGNEPFIGTAKKPLGAGFYPEDMTASDLEQLLKANPTHEKAIRGYFTVIQKEGDKLKVVRYSEAYGPRLKQAAALLKEAAALSQHPALKKYLELRAAAFLSDDYYNSDMAWMELGDSPLEVVLGPYEVYEDKLMGYKASFEAFINLRDPVYSARLQKLDKYLQQLEDNLPIPKWLRTKRGSESPISVVIELFTAGDTRAGVQTAAFNLPNDERVRTEKGSKKVLLKNVTEAKFNKVLMPIARKVVDKKLLRHITFDAYFTEILIHEMAHGVGPGKITVRGRQTEVNKELKELYPAIEECKADIVGLHSGYYLIKKRALPRALKKQLPAAYVAGVFRAIRFGTKSAHARGVLLAFNYLMDKGAITYKDGRFGVDYKKFPGGIKDLSHELLMIQAKGSYDGAKTLLDSYGVLKPEMKEALDKLGDVPVDIRPNYTIEQKMKSW